MRVYLLNLDKDVDRLMAADRRLQSLGIKYERISAICGKDLSPAEKRAKVSYFRWWCTVGIPPRDGEIGCAISHLTVYQRLVESGDKCVCVLEDDIVLDSRFPAILKFAELNISCVRPQVFLLSNHSDFYENTGNGDRICGYKSAKNRLPEVKRTSGDAFTEGYVLNVPAAKALLRQQTPIKIFADAWRRWAKIGAIELYHILPTVCSQDKSSFVSSTILHDKSLDVSKMSWQCWFWHKFKRCIGCAIDNMLIRLGL